MGFNMNFILTKHAIARGKTRLKIGKNELMDSFKEAWRDGQLMDHNSLDGGLDWWRDINKIKHKGVVYVIFRDATTFSTELVLKTVYSAKKNKHLKCFTDTIETCREKIRNKKKRMRSRDFKKWLDSF